MELAASHHHRQIATSHEEVKHAAAEIRKIRVDTLPGPYDLSATLPAVDSLTCTERYSVITLVAHPRVEK